MAKTAWLADTALLEGYTAVQLGRMGPNTELALVGYHGEGWENGSSYRAFLTKTGISRINRLHGLDLTPLKGGEETILGVKDQLELEKVLEAIKYTSRRPTQARLANSR